MLMHFIYIFPAMLVRPDLGQHELHLVRGDAAGLVLAEHAERLLEALLTNQR